MSESALANPSWWLPTWTLWRREMVRFIRQRSRVVGALGTPVLFWAVIGSGLGRSFRVPGFDATVNYLEYSFPGTLVLIVLFTSVFSMISIIEDRREGFLQSVLVAPVPRSTLVMGKVLGCTSLAVGQSLLFLLASPLAGIPLSLSAFAYALAVLILIGLGLSGLGFLLAWPMDSTQGFHAIMNLFLIPMWLLSGAFFPGGGAMLIVRWCMVLNPLTYAVGALRYAMYDSSSPYVAGLPGQGWCMVITFALASSTITASVLMVNRSWGRA